MRHILVVDDDVAVATLVASALADYDVTIAHNGADALAVAEQRPCALLITDYVMPSMAGDEPIGRLRDSQPAVRALLITGYGSYIDIDGCPIDAQLAKPLPIDVLRKTVETLIGPAR